MEGREAGPQSPRSSTDSRAFPIPAALLMTKELLPGLLLWLAFGISLPLLAEEKSGLKLEYIKEQDALPPSALGQNFYWKWSSVTPENFEILVIFEFDGSVQGIQGIGDIKGVGRDGTITVSLASMPLSDTRQDKLRADFASFICVNKTATENGISMKEAHTYWGNGANDPEGLPAKWPTKYIGTPLKVTFKDGVVTLGKKTLLAEAVRQEHGSTLHEVAVYLILKEDGVSMEKVLKEMAR